MDKNYKMICFLKIEWKTEKLILKYILFHSSKIESSLTLINAIDKCF